MTNFTSGPECEIQQFAWVPKRSGTCCYFIRNKIKICQLWNMMANNFITTFW